MLVGDPGFGTRPTALAAANEFTPDVTISDGSWRRAGYLAGFENLALELLQYAERYCPDLAAKHEHTLKRLWPFRSSVAFRTPRDLTNSSGREERTRFYHHEYQNKLLVGLAEFALEALEATNRKIALIVDNGHDLPATSRSFMNILQRTQGVPTRIRVLVLDKTGALLIPKAERIIFPPLTRNDFGQQLDGRALTSAQMDLLYERAAGNPEVGATLCRCMGRGLVATDHLSVEAIVSLHVASLPIDERIALARSFVSRRLVGDLIDERNAATLPAGILDEMNASAHDSHMEQHRSGSGPLVFAHALSLSDKYKRAEALVEPSEILMGIGLYDTWFEYFSSFFSDPDLRTRGTGGNAVNGLFINAAFVLYAMGFAAPALGFLELFLKTFPDSTFVPTALYAQSMTYGRYQIPVDLNRAEACAIANLRLIDEKFPAHPRYKYIKVFAENAYAYIKARKGELQNALELCERGITEIVDAYGSDRFQLHRSILIYNTSQVYELAGDFVRAEARLREAIACDPYYAEYYNDLGNLLGRFEDRRVEALEAYERAIALSPPYYEAHLNRGMLRTEIGDLAEAKADFERALQIKPSEWRAMRELGNLHLQEGSYLRALEIYDRALQHETSDPDLHANAALAASELGQSDRALEQGRIAIKLNPRHPAAHNNLAAEFLKSGDFDQALEHARIAAEYGNDPDYAMNVRTIETLRSKTKQSDRKTRH